MSLKPYKSLMFLRNCPKCCIIMEYSYRKTVDRANTNGSLCQSCANSLSKKGVKRGTYKKKKKVILK